MVRNFENLKYDDEVMLDIKLKISLLGIVDSYFKSFSTDQKIRFDKAKIINDEIKLKIHPNFKFYYNFCPFHSNGVKYYAFFVDERVQLYYCLGCGSGGNAFDFLEQVYDLDINEAAEILGCIANIFNISNLNNKQLEIYNTLIENYQNKDELLEKSREKTVYLTERVSRYLELHPLDKEEVDYQDFKKIADRLCCDIEFVKEMYEKTNYYQEKQREEKRKKLIKNKEIMFN